MKRFALVMAAVPMVLSCAGAPGKDGQSFLTRVAVEPIGKNCADGGVRIESGPDGNANGVLDPGESTTTQFVCNLPPATDGAPGKDGANGKDGTNGTNGKDGRDGVNGIDGKTTLTNLLTESAGANCASGGVKVQNGLDTNGNNVLEASEVSSTRYICNGSGGTGGGAASRIAVTPEAAGGNCSNAGMKVQTGADTNNNGTLDASEVTSTQYVCNGTNGTGGTGGGGTAVSSFNNSEVDAGATPVTLTQLSITVTRPGTIIAIGTVDAYCSSGGGSPACGTTSPFGDLTISDVSSAAASSGSNDFFALSPNFTEAITRTQIYPVASAGTRTYYLRGDGASGTVGFFRSELTLIFVPN